MYVCSAAEKALIINILDILKKYSDKNHRLSQKDIIDILDKEYCMKIDRKTVKRNLIEFGYAIEYSKSIRLVKDKNGEEVESKILSDFYINRPFTDGELRLLIDSVLFSNHISYSQCRDLVEKLEGLSNIYFRSRVKHIRNLPENQPSNSELFMTIETLDKAISRGLQVSFTYRNWIHAGQAIMKYETTLLIRIRLLLQTADTILYGTMTRILITQHKILWAAQKSV